MKLSIIVPVYNMAGGGNLEYCLDSLINQTINDYEIIAVDDASSDNSLDILREYERKYPDKVKVLHSDENLRQGGARNIGLNAASGTWIGFVDSDDWVSPDMYEKLVAKAEERRADVVGCDYCLVTRHTMEVGKVVTCNTSRQVGYLRKNQLKSLALTPGSMVVKIYRKDVIDKYNLRFPEKTFYEDNCASPIWMLHFTHFERVDEPLYYYYQHDDSTVHEISMEKCEDRLKMGKLMIEEAKRYDLFEPYYRQFEFNFTKVYYMNTLYTYLIGVKKRDVKFLKKIGDGMLETYPNFQKNQYYRTGYDAEQKRMAALNLKSPRLCIIYFDLLNFYRKKIRKTIQKTK